MVSCLRTKIVYSAPDRSHEKSGGDLCQLRFDDVEANVAESTLGNFPDGNVVANSGWTPADGETVILTPWGTDTGIGLLVTDAPLDATSVRYGWKGEPLQDAAALARQHYQAATGRVRLQ
jgi:hypothetical protein